MVSGEVFSLAVDICAVVLAPVGKFTTHNWLQCRVEELRHFATKPSNRSAETRKSDSYEIVYMETLHMLSTRNLPCEFWDFAGPNTDVVLRA